MFVTSSLILSHVKIPQANMTTFEKLIFLGVTISRYIGFCYIILSTFPYFYFISHYPLYFPIFIQKKKKWKASVLILSCYPSVGRA